MNNVVYNERIAQMQSYLRIASIPSSHSIYIYLYIYGKMTYNDLMQKLNFSRGTIFTGLKVLQEAELITKYEDPTIKDKRKNVFYRANQMSLEVDIDQSFLNYLMQHDHLKTYLQYVQLSQTLSMSMMSVAIEISQNKKIQRMQDFLTNVNSKKIEPPTINDTGKQGLFYHEIKSLNDRTELTKKLHGCIQEFEKQAQSLDQESEDPLQDAVIFSIVFADLN